MKNKTLVAIFVVYYVISWYCLARSVRISWLNNAK